MDHQPTTLVELLRRRAERNGDSLAYSFLESGTDQEQRITYAELDRKARMVAAELAGHGGRGERALLLFPPGLDFIAAFFGCLYAGVTAVPAYPPRLNRPMPRIQAIVKDARARFALTTTSILESVEQRFEHEPLLRTLDWINCERLDAGQADGWRAEPVAPDQLAFLQYTSGSTSAPKGVMLTHQNLMYNLEMIRQGFHLGSDERGVFWLPSYHDMGLIGGILEPMYIAGPSQLLSPVAFLQRPLRWLQGITRFRATITGAPNFAFDLCVEKISEDQKETLDLSSLRLCFTGAEPVRSDTLRRFSANFASCGFRSEAFYPCYGLAEATLLASGGDGPGEPVVNRFDTEAIKQNRIRPAAGDRAGQDLVGSGRALLEERIIIVDPDSLQVCPPDQIGEIWIAGPNVARGYWERPELNQELFAASALDEKGGRYLRTGDLGFFFEGELYITGRLKDLIIIRGKNHYPQDIEETIGRAHVAIQNGACAAFSFEQDGEEKLAVVCELTRQHRKTPMAEMLPALRSAVAEHHDVQLSAVTLVRPLSIPKTSSGKIKRRATRAAFLGGDLEVVAEWQTPRDARHQQAPTVTEAASDRSDPLQGGQSPAKTVVLDWILQALSEKLKMPLEQISPDEPFASYGLDSAQAVGMTGELEIAMQRTLPPTLAWDFPTPRLLADHLARPAETEKSRDRPAQAPARSDRSDEGIAIIGLSCRFPGARDAGEFWDLLRNGVDAIAEVPADRFPVDEFFDPSPATPGKMNSRWGGFLNEVDRFDPGFFNISPREAARMDPQQRLLLEVTWEALENAGLSASWLSGSSGGVFIGISSYDYSRAQFQSRDRLDAYAGTGNAHSIAANRISYFLDLRGPSVAVDTACSSSLVAVHLACQSLRTGEIDLAVSGGVNLILSPELTIAFSQARMLSPQGRCRTFDARADGYVRGEGCGVVVLKRLRDAQRDRDQILAVIKGSAINQDGKTNGLTAPNGPSQEAVIRRALADAAIQPDQVGYVEAHGTGTPLGDPIEFHALGNVLANGWSGSRAVLVGSVKTNIGHLEAAAGIAGLIKTVLALHHEQIPAHLHFRSLNPHISPDGVPLQVAHSPHPWPRQAAPRIAGVSSFGFGGTNAHMILSEAPASSPAAADEKSHTAGQAALLTLSAKSEPALRTLIDRYARADLEPLADAAYTTNAGRSHFDYRVSVIAREPSEAVEELRSLARSGELPDPHTSGKPPKIAFLLSGQGAQYGGMAAHLYARIPIFRKTLDVCARLLESRLDRPLLSLLFADQPGFDQELVHQTQYAQPALFAVEYALATMWRSWGIEPDYLLGHSVGELAAASLSGILGLEEGLELVCTRGRLMQEAPGSGAMLAVLASKEAVIGAVSRSPEAVSIAALNGPEQVVLSGVRPALEALQAEFERSGVTSKFLRVSHAFHSPLMEPVLAAFRDAAEAIPYAPSRIPLVSNHDGRLLTGSEASTPEYWVSQIRSPVAFHDGVVTLLDLGVDIFLEVGPRPALLPLVRRITRYRGMNEKILLPTIAGPEDDGTGLLQALGELYEQGLDINWRAYHQASRRRKLWLPNYPFERDRYWLTAYAEPGVGAMSPQLLPPAEGKTPVGKRLAIAIPAFEFQVDSLDQPLLVELAVAAARQVHGAPHGWLRQIHFRHPLPLEHDSAGLVQVFLDDPDNRLSPFRIFSRAGRDEWLLIAEGTIEIDQPVTPPPVRTGAAESPAPPETEDGPEPFLVQAAAKSLGLEPNTVQTDRPLTELGLDSLMAIDLRNTIEGHFGVQIPVKEFLAGPTLRELAQKIRSPDESASPMLADPIPVGDWQGAHPLTHGQQALWFLHELTDQGTSFNIAGAVRIRGEFDVPRFEQALQRLMDGHLVLRTNFRMHDGRPVQEVDPQPVLPFLELDASGWSAERLDDYLRREAWRKFDLERDAPFRVRLIRIAPSGQRHEQILLFAVDHIVADFWSVGLILRDLLRDYTLGDQPVAPGDSRTDQEVKFVDFARWQLAQTETGRITRSAAYWRSRLGEELPLLDLPTDYPRPAAQTFQGETAYLRLPAGLLKKLKDRALEQNTTLFNILLAAFQLLLFRYTNQGDFTVGTAMAGRDRPELAEMVGYLINPVALKADLSADQTFLELLNTVRQTVLEAFEHQDYPLLLLAEELKLQRDLSRPPIFETMFIYQQAQVLQEEGLSAFAIGLPGSRLTLQDVDMEIIALKGHPAQFDLTLMMAEAEQHLLASMQYSTSLFSAETVQRMLAHLENLLEGIAADPGRELGEYSLMGADEIGRLAAWNRTHESFLFTGSVAALLDSSRSRHGERIAVQSGAEQLSYHELHQRSDILAAYLIDRGVGANSRVGLYLKRSVDLLIALLGTLKAGAAYVPLDPAFPKARTAYMLADAGVELILAHQDLIEQLDPDPVSIVDIADEQIWSTIPGEPNRIQPGDAEDLAYLIYTSGSTGKPKGVQIPNRAVVNFLQTMMRRPGINEHDILLAVTTLSFDISVLELLLPLVAGARVVIARQEETRDGLALAELIDREGITMMQATPETWRLLLESGFQGREGLRMLCGGEALPPALARQLLSRGAELWNMYGPTETTVWSTIQQIEQAEGTIPIGKPIANTVVYVLDARRQPVPIGVYGELYIGGDGVSSGYHNRADLNREKFLDRSALSLPEEIGLAMPGRLFRTGDLARWRADGSLELAGRLDSQIKLRGYRIELGEIEAVMNDFAGVRKSAARLHADAQGQPAIAGYVVADDPEESFSTTALRQWMAKYLPAYMIPAHLVVLERMPVTLNGKVSRRDLPAPPTTRPELRAEFVAPRTETEAKLAHLCAETLGLQDVGVLDDFFELGGNSLQATRFVFQVREQFEAHILLRRLFEDPTIAGLARLIDGAETSGDKESGILQRKTVAELLADVALDDSIAAGGRKWSPRDPESLLLTGSTGFLGAFLLRELLDQTEAQIYCLVRAENRVAAYSRLEQNLRHYELWDEKLAARIVPLAGDLSQSNLGLAESDYARCAGLIDGIIHNGAQVSFIHSYGDHMATNVAGTREILRLASLDKLKPVHFISTLSVFHTGEHDEARVYTEAEDLEETGAPLGGYAQSKWVAEKLVHLAGSRGIPVSIFRPGIIAGHSQTGSWNHGDLIWSLARACLAIGKVPILPGHVDIVPVDYVSRAIVEMVRKAVPDGRAFHLGNPQTFPYDGLIEQVRRLGLPVDLAPFDSWRQALFSQALNGDLKDWNAFLPILEEVQLEQIFMPRFDASNTLAQLRDSGIQCPPVGRELLSHYLRFFNDQGFLR